MTTRLLMVVSVLALAARATAELPPTALPSIAVIDFANRNQADDIHWLGKSLADMVITDLAASSRLVVVDRERTQEIGRELELQSTGLVDEKTASRVGHVARVQWVLFGSFAREGTRISIEAMIIDLRSQQVRRVERVEGEFAALFELERQLLRGVLAKIDVPMGEEELRSVRLLETRSLRAVEHYGRALVAFDDGELFDALAQVRLAVKADAGFGKAKGRLAQLYYLAGELPHAVIEYRGLLAADENRELPDETYLDMGRVFEEAEQDDQALDAYRRLISRHAAELHPTTPPPADTQTAHNAFFDKLMPAVRALDRSAAIQDKRGQPMQALECYSRIFFALHYYRVHNTGARVGAFADRIWKEYDPRYLQAVRENSEGTLTPVWPMKLINPDEHPRADRFIPYRDEPKPDDPWARHASWYLAWLAPPGKEIARISYDCDTASNSPDTPKNAGLFTGWREPPGIGQKGPLFFMMNDGVKPVAMDVPPGVRAAVVDGGKITNLHFELRPWKALPKKEAPGSIFISVIPGPAQVFVDGRPLQDGRRMYGFLFESDKEADHKVEARWITGGRVEQTVHLTPGRKSEITLNAFLASAAKVSITQGGARHPHAMTDRAGRHWLVWDEAMPGDRASNQASDLYASASLDGVRWSPKRRLLASSLALDAAPVLQQDRRGRFWLAWVSDRDPQDPGAYWLASSPDGQRWSFPRKIKLDPSLDKDELKRWRMSDYARRAAFAIDHDGVFWIVCQGYLYSSDDGRAWKRVETLKLVNAPKPDHHEELFGYQLAVDPGNHLVVLAGGVDSNLPSGHQFAERLWRRGRDGGWTKLGSHEIQFLSRGGVAFGADGGGYWASCERAVQLWTQRPGADWPAESIPIAAGWQDPVTLPLGGGRVLVAYAAGSATSDFLSAGRGLEAVVFEPADEAPVDRALVAKAAEVDRESRMGYGVAFVASPIYADEALFNTGTTTVTINNPADCHMDVEGSVAASKTLLPERQKLVVRVPPKGNATVKLAVKAAVPTPIEKLDTLQIDWKYRYQLLGMEPLAYTKSTLVGVTAVEGIPRRTAPVAIDGKLDDWKRLPFLVDKPGQVRLDPASHTGPKDLTFRFCLEYDDDYLYIAVEAIDDHRVLDSKKQVWDQDGIEVRLDPRPTDRWDSGIEFVDYPCILLSPPAAPDSPMLVYRQNTIPPGVKFVCVNTDKGHATEIAIPVSYLEASQGKPWRKVRLNIAVDDYDPGDKGAQVWWRADWRFEKNVAGTGTLRRD